MGERGKYTLHIYCDSPDCEFLPMGPVEGEPRMGIFTGSEKEGARQSAIRQGWKRPKSRINTLEGGHPAWICPSCISQARFL